MGANHPLLPQKVTIYSDDFKQYLKALLIDCLSITGNGDYDLSTTWHEVPCPTDDPKDPTCTNADVKVDDVYLCLYVNIYPNIIYSWDRRDYTQLARQMLHECCHAYLAPVQRLYEWDMCPSQMRPWRDIIERQTQRITNSLWELLKDDWYLPANVLKPPLKEQVASLERALARQNAEG